MERALQCNRRGEIAKAPAHGRRRWANRRVLFAVPLSPFAPFAVGALAGALGFGALARAQQAESEAIRLVYRAPAVCPDEATFIDRVRARTTRVRLAVAGEAARAFTVEVEGGRGSVGRVVVEARDHSQATREVRADTCSDVVDALALMVALAIDPAAVGPAAPAAREAPSAATASSASPVSGAVRQPGSGGVFGGADFAVATDVAPRTLLAGSPYVGWRSAKTDRLLAPSLRVAFILAGSGTLGIPGGSAAFTWTVGRFDGCPIAWPQRAVWVTECVRVEAGALEAAAGMDVPAPRAPLRAWLSAGVLARAEWSLLPPIFVDAEAGALLRVTQDRFYFNPGTATAFQVPPLGVTAGVGVGALFF